MGTTTKTCEYCRGSGFIRTNVYCRECGGSGKLTYYDAQIGKEVKKAANSFLDAIFLLLEKPLAFLIPGLIIYAIAKNYFELSLGYLTGTFIVGAYLHAYILFSSNFAEVGKIHKGFIIASLALFSLLMTDFTKIQEADMTIPCIIGFFVVNFVSFYKWYFRVLFAMALVVCVLLLLYVGARGFVQ